MDFFHGLHAEFSRLDTGYAEVQVLCCFSAPSLSEGEMRGFGSAGGSVAGAASERVLGQGWLCSGLSRSIGFDGIEVLCAWSDKAPRKTAGAALPAPAVRSEVGGSRGKAADGPGWLTSQGSRALLAPPALLCPEAWAAAGGSRTLARQPKSRLAG